MEQEYWVTVRQEEAGKFNPRAEVKPLKKGLVKIWYGVGIPGRTRVEDEERIRNNLSKSGISPLKITTS